nr:hypothetical protein [Tanacetum cinerariifolium]
MQTDTMIYSGSVTKLLFSLLQSPIIQLESYFKLPFGEENLIPMLTLFSDTKLDVEFFIGVESSNDEENLGDDASKQGRIEAIDVDKDITLVNVQDDVAMFDVNDLGGEEVFVAEQEVVKDVKENVFEEVVNAAQVGKGIMIEEPVKPKKKYQIKLDEEAAKRLQADFDEEERFARERAKKEQETNISLIETWDDIQTKINTNHQLAERFQAQE